jgi:hypothetical protein
MRALFAYLLAIGICLAIGYAEMVWLVKTSQTTASEQRHSKGGTQSEANHIAHERSSASAALNAMSPDANEGEGKSLRTSDSASGQPGSDQSTEGGGKTPAVSTAETKSDHQTIGLGHHEKNVNSPSLASMPRTEPDPLSGSKVGPRSTSEPRTAEENDHRLGKGQRDSQDRSYLRRQRFSELLKHPLEVRCITCVMFNQ